jgi:transposase
MSLRTSPIEPVPEETARVAHAAFRKGNPLLELRDELGTVFSDGDFADLYPGEGQPAYPPWRLALVTVLQFREGLSDRQAAEAVRARIDWKYLLGLELADAGFDFSLLSEFRARLLAGGAEERLLGGVLEACRRVGLLRPRGRQRTDATRVLAAVRELNRLELVAETMRAALDAIATAAPGWLRALAPPAWHGRYGRRIEDARLPATGPKREAFARQVGEDGFRLLDAVAAPAAPEAVDGLPAVRALREVWARHFERVTGGPAVSPPGPGRVRRRPVGGRGRIASPHDVDARFCTKGGAGWVGYMVHLTETCDEGAPRLVVHADTTPADIHEAMRTGAIHDALAAKGLAPREHLVDAGYVSAGHFVAARERHGIDLVGPTRRGASWHHRTEGAFGTGDFLIDWARERVRCPEGKESVSWRAYGHARGARGRYAKVRFDPADCRACRSRARCTRAVRDEWGRQLSLRPRAEHEALAAAGARREAGTDRRLRALRRGVEGTISQAVRAFGLRRARYRGLAKTRLQHLAAAAALDLDRAAAWLQGRPLTTTRTSRFAALAA